MAVLLKSLLPALAWLIPTAATGSGLPVVKESALGLAARACVGLPTSPAEARLHLTRQGWGQGSFNSPDGTRIKEAEEQLEIYSRDGLLLLMNPSKPDCLVTAKVKRSLKPERLLEIVQAALGRAPLSSTPGTYMWSFDNGQALMARLGRNGEDAHVQIVVTPSNQKKN